MPGSIEASRVAQSSGVARATPGYSPWKDPTVLLLSGIVVAVLVAAIGGVTVGPAGAGDDEDGGVFPVFDVIWGDDGPEEVAVSLTANRSTVEAGDSVAFSVTADGDPFANATVSVAGERYTVDDEGRVVVQLAEPGTHTASASGPDTNETVYPPDDLRVNVEPPRVDLAVRTNRSPAVAGEPVGLRLHRADTGATVDGDLRVRFVTGPGPAPFDRAPSVSVAPGEAFVPDGAGLLVVVGSATSPDVAFDNASRVLLVQRRAVALALELNRTAAVAGESASARVTRTDTDAGVPARLVVTDPTGERRTVETDADGRGAVPLDRAGSWRVEAGVDPTASVRFVPEAGAVAVDRRVVDLAVELDRPAITAGGSVRVAVRRADEDTPLPATVEIGDRTVETGDDGAVEVVVGTPGDHTVRATTGDTPAATFEPGEAALSVSNTTIDLGGLDAPGTVAPGADLSVSVAAENVGEVAGADALVLAMAGADRDATTVRLAPGESATATLAATAPAEPGSYEVSVRGSDATRTATLVVEAE